MTQSVANNVNNIQEMMLQAQQKVNSVVSEINSATKKTIGLDKNLDFKSDNKFDKVFNKQLEKESRIEEVSSSHVDSKSVPPTNAKTLDDIKMSKSESSKDSTLVSFVDVLSEVNGEMNAETALNLTLGRDINEVINQLKGTISTTAETDESEETVSDVLDEAVVIDEEVVEEIQEDVILDSSTEDSSTKFSVAFEQVLTKANQSTVALDEQDNFDQRKNEISMEISEDVITVDEAIETSVETTTKLSAEKTELTGKTLEDIIDEDTLKELNIESVETETVSSDGQGSLMEQQSPEEQGIKAMLTQEIEAFDLKLEKVSTMQMSQATQAKSVETSSSKIIEQISKQMENLQNNSKVNIVLNPESLGRVTIQLIKTGEGLSAQFTVANQEVRDMLMKGLDSLKETLTAHGVGVDNVSVKLNDTQKSEYNADWTEQEGSRGGNKEQDKSHKDEKEKELFEQMMAQFNEENGNV